MDEQKGLKEKNREGKRLFDYNQHQINLRLVKLTDFTKENFFS